MPVKSREQQRTEVRRRRVAMALAGIGLGLVCRVVPVEYQWPCAAVTKLLAALMGVA